MYIYIFIDLCYFFRGWGVTLLFSILPYIFKTKFINLSVPSKSKLYDKFALKRNQEYPKDAWLSICCDSITQTHHKVSATVADQKLIS